MIGEVHGHVERPMRALEVFVIYVAPFFIIGMFAKILMKRSSVDLTDVQAQAGASRRPRKVFLLGAGAKRANVACSAFFQEQQRKKIAMAPEAGRVYKPVASSVA
jgi:hypothetical protein